MPKLKQLLKAYLPANNVIFGFAGGLIAAVVQRYASKWGYDAPDSIANALPGAIAIVLAHAWDVYTGENKPNPATPDTVIVDRKEIEPVK